MLARLLGFEDALGVTTNEFSSFSKTAFGLTQQPEFLHDLVVVCCYTFKALETYRLVDNIYLLGLIQEESTQIVSEPGGDNFLIV
jgi:hypothetical protein